MTKTLYITNGPYAGQYLTLDEPYDQLAVTDEWAVDTTDEKEFDRWDWPHAINEHPYPNSLDNFLAGLNPNNPPPELEQEGVDKSEVVQRRKTAREEQKKQREEQKARQAKREQREQAREAREQADRGRNQEEPEEARRGRHRQDTNGRE
jgi:hypothetical protein